MRSVRQFINTPQFRRWFLCGVVTLNAIFLGARGILFETGFHKKAALAMSALSLVASLLGLILPPRGKRS